ncbi:MAG: alpha/beta hydrolase [Bacteroidota bacterium]
MKRLFFLFLFGIISGMLQGQSTEDSYREYLYKTIDTVELTIGVYSPDSAQFSGVRPAIVFYFGGGWNGGTPDHFRPQAQHFASRGMVAIVVDYRVAKRHGTTPFESLQDAKSAMRYVRAHAEMLGIDPKQIVAGGGSAGGHLAAACATITAYDDPADDLSVSPVPNALVLFNPVYDNGPDGYGYERIGDAYPNFSPLHNLKIGTPPTLVLFGTEDALVPVETIATFQAKMDSVGSRCETILYQGEKHGFFNTRNPFHFQQTLMAADVFLTDLGYLPNP